MPLKRHAVECGPTIVIMHFIRKWHIATYLMFIDK
jgi:hypothetical protein